MGHAFRKDYLDLVAIRQWHPEASWIALTATATPRVAGHIEALLALRNPARFRMPMRRDNLAFRVLQVPGRHDAVADWARRTAGSAILYVRTRRDAEAMASLLQRAGVRAAAYHAGMDRPIRDLHQSKWISGELRVLACTTAFGMGIDKPDVRAIAHAHVPETPESYIQEAGRAGRDGRPAEAVILVDSTALAEAEAGWPDNGRPRNRFRRCCNPSPTNWASPSVWSRKTPRRSPWMNWPSGPLAPAPWSTGASICSSAMAPSRCTVSPQNGGSAGWWTTLPSRTSRRPRYRTGA